MINYQKFELKNGLTVLLNEDTTTPLVALNILYKVGARNENPNKTGFAHLFEHLMFGGSINIPNYDEPLERAGGENNAFTNNDITNYYLTIPAQNIETAFWLESDRMLNLAFNEKNLDVQRNVVIEEFKQRYLNQPYGDVWLLLRPLAYKVHPYRWPTIGEKIEHIADATLDDVKSFFNRYYKPNNAVLSVSGNINLDQLKNLCEKWFAPIDAGNEITDNIPKEPLQKKKRHLTEIRDVPSSALYMAFHCCSRLDKDYFSTDLTSDILSGGKSSRLYTKLVKEQKLFTSINAYQTGSVDKGLFIVQGKVSNGTKLETAEEAVWNELNLIKENGVGDKELEKVSNNIESILTFDEMQIGDKALNLAFFEMMGSADDYNSQQKKYNQVTTEEVKERAIELFQEDNCSTLYYQSSNG